MKKRPLLLASLLTACLGTWLIATAQPALDQLKRLDQDGDGRLSREEVPMPALFDAIDKDGDGFLTPAEILKAGLLAKLRNRTPAQDGLPLDKVFNWLDKNRDGKLDPTELTHSTHRARLDTDQDGFVTLEEARAVIGDFVPRSMLAAGSAPEAAPVEDEATLKEQPQILKAADHGIGRRLPDLPLLDSNGRHLTLPPRTTILALFSPVCPISRKLGPELARLEKESAEKGFSLFLVNTLPSAHAETIDRFLTDFDLACPVIHDGSADLLHALAATSTTEAFILDAARTLVYRGAVNDQYGLGYAKDQPTRTYLRDALADLAAGRTVKIAATTAPGCALDLSTQPAPAAPAVTLTYHNQISRIIQANCVECHHQGGLAPFSLETMQDLIDHAGMVKKQIQRGAMPPWFAAPTPAGQDSPWANDRSLSEQDKADLLAWLNGTRAEGDPAHAPLARQFESEWTIGQPDYIVPIPKPIPIKAEGVMPYQFVVAETNLSEDRWVQGYEIIPTDRAVVHHVIVQVHEKGKPIRDREEGLDGYWAAYVPGNASKVYPSGFARKLPAGARVSFQIHYTPNGRATEDQLRLGLIFAKEPPRYAVRTLAMAQRQLDIPPGAAHHVHTLSRTLPVDVTIMAFMAHMHVRGKSFRFDLTLPDGSQETLLDIPRYDFNWQLRYDLKQPRLIPAGSTVTITAAFDNSPGNPANPDPGKRVRWGPQTYDEMMLGYFETFSPLPPPAVATR